MPKLTLPAILALGAVAYFVFFRKSASAATPTGPRPAPGPTPSALPPWVDPAAKAASELVRLGAGLAREAGAVEGMAPATLAGQVAALGGYGDLGGSFYGSH